MYVLKNALIALACLTVIVHAVDFQKDIKPILEKRCVSCHGEKKDKGDLRLHTHNELIKSKVVIAGKVEKSSLYELINLPEDHDDIMPPKGDPLTKSEIAKVKEWINSGANWPSGVKLQDRSKEPAQPESTMIAKTEAFKKLVPLINKYCVDCHNADKQKGDFRIDDMDQDLVYGIHAQRWHEVLDIINLGEMPPKKSKQLTDAERKQLIGTLTNELHKAKEARKGQITTVMRRLNNQQYNNTLRDLLGVDFDFAKDLPEDAFSPEGFKNNGETLDMSTLQMEYYMAIARKALSKAIKTEKPEVMKFHVDFGQNKYPKIKEGITMGPGGRLIPTTAYKISAPIPERNYPYTHIRLREEFVYNEGYKGNGTIKGDKTFKGLHYAVYPELIPSHKDKIVKEGLVLSPRGDIPIGRGGAKGPSNHMRLVLRDFPQEGPVTIKVMASKSPNSLITSYVGKSPIATQPLITKVEAKPTYPPKSNLQKPDFIITDVLTVDKAGIYQLDAQLDSEIDGPVNIHIGKTLLEGVRIKKGAANLIVPIAITKLDAGKTPIKITSRKNPEFATFALTLLKSASDEARNFEKAIRKSKQIATAYYKKARARFSTKENAFEKKSISQKVASPRPVKEGEYHVPQPTNFTVKRGFTIKENGLYQIDFKLSQKLKNGLDLTVNSSIVKNLKYKFKSAGNYSTALVELQKGSHILELLSKGEIPVSEISFTKVNSTEATELFTAYQSEQYGYLRAFIGNRRDDGQEFLATKDIFKVDAPLYKPQLIEFNLQMDDFPLPAYDPKNKNYLANLLHLGFWNTPWNRQKNTDIVIHSIEFESNVSATWPPKSHTDIFIDSNKGNEKQYARTVLANFLPKVYRKSLSDDELNRHIGFFEALRPHHTSFENTIKEVLAISLSSPQFLYISEPDGTSRKQLTEAELASRLSYFLWNTMPDAELMSAAKNKTLKKNLKQHLSRMIQDPRSFNMSKNFSSQWLDVERLERVVVDKKYAGGYNRDIKTSFKNETYNFFHHVLSSNGSIMEFIDSDYAVLDWRLANFYGLPPVNSLGFKAVPVRKDQKRGGILTHGGILTALSTGKHSSPIKRGVWIAKKIVDSPPPKPPPNVPELDEENPELAKLTRKAQLEKHRDNASCRDCHMKIDPWGIPFEHYDTTGRYKSKGHFDAGTQFPDGKKVTGLQELKKYLITDKKDLVTRSLVKYLGSYAIGRSLSFVDEDEVKKIMADAKSNGYKLQAIIESIVRSDLFQKF